MIISEDSRRSPKTSEDVRSLPKAKLSSPSLRTRINSSSLPVLFASKIRDREEGIVIYSFYTWFSFLTWVWVNIFFGNCVKQDGNNSHFSIRREKLVRRRERAWDRSFQPAGVRLTPKAWELAGIVFLWFQRVAIRKNYLWTEWKCKDFVFRTPFWLSGSV